MIGLLFKMWLEDDGKPSLSTRSCWRSFSCLSLVLSDWSAPTPTTLSRPLQARSS